MILNREETRVVASCGWVEKSALLVIDLRLRREELLQIGAAKYIELQKLPGDYFLARQHYSGEQVILGIHSFSDPARKLAEVTVTSRSLRFRGEDNLWKLAPKYCVAALKDPEHGFDYRLVEINPGRTEEVFPALEWYDNTYDKDWQGVLDVIEIPGTGCVLFSVQRSSEPVLYDVARKKVVTRIKLAGRNGNPYFSFRNNQQELWCVDYDTLIKKRVSDWKTLKKKLLQGGTLQTDRNFIGGFSFTPNEKYCAVARPFSRDLVLIEGDSFQVVAESGSQFQPISTAVLSNLDFVARDWPTGRVEYGSFQIKKKFWFFQHHPGRKNPGSP